MAFLKTASAVVVNPVVDWTQWSEISDRDFSSRTASKIVAEYDPKEYCLSHCTIIASVDVEEDPEHYITPETAKFVNNNYDAWERNLLLGCYKSFVGADNFVEHVQIAEQSKGKVIDAVAREVIFPGKTASDKEAKSIYVDILVATDRKHKDLVKKIESGETNKLSMGCVVAWTFCSKCGNKAEDSVQLCHHIRYLKGNKFIDNNGVERIIAELCGHKDDPESVQFIDASWVKNPAFEGAVTRNIVAPKFELKDKIKSAFEIKPLKGDEGLKLKKVANTSRYILAQGEEDAPAETEEAAPPPPEEDAPTEETPPEEDAPTEEAAPVETETPEELEKPTTFVDIKDVIKQEIKERAKEEAKEELLKELSDEIQTARRTREYIPDEALTHDTLVKSNTKPLNEFESYKYNDISSKIKKIFGSKSESITKAILALSQGKPWESLRKFDLDGRDGILLSAFISSELGKQDPKIYKAALKAKDFKTKEAFIKYCKTLFKRDLTQPELKKISSEILRYNLLEQKDS